MGKALKKMFPKVGTHKTPSAFWDAFIAAAARGTKETVTEAVGDYLQEAKVKSAAKASISKDPDQTTKWYPGYLRDSAYGYIDRSTSRGVEGKVGFGAEYAYAHHEEPKNYRYGDIHFLSDTIDELGFTAFIKHLDG